MLCAIGSGEKGKGQKAEVKDPRRGKQVLSKMPLSSPVPFINSVNLVNPINLLLYSA
jgi:hypothetical protein